MHKNTSSDIFCLNNAQLDGNQIFSIGGSPSFRINRRREPGSNVFPYGCMGNVNTLSDTSISDEPNQDIVKEVEENVVTLPEPVEEIPPPIRRTRITPAPPYQGLSARNPLTGEGIELPNPNKGKKGSGRRTAKWTW